ncbi:b3544017-67b4-4eff-91bc-808bc17ad6fd [Thermothielavioides terrestris]|uniref:Autophagy-related protein 14 n=1 Tax=Thermothielavioides terrestris TaxID=2587410 RepID=A0A446B8H9_9PEZI|nr:b3544017-67b4-4eff-91bc-808bc17ad6fd [Thermothielavioides terrestris]
MNCSICHRPHHAKKLPFLCAVDARNCLYESRVEYAQALIETEDAEHRVEAALASQEGVGVTQDAKFKTGAHVDWLRAEEAAAADRTSQIIAQADRLKDEIDAARREIAAKKKAIAQKKSDLASASAGTWARWNRQLDEVQRSTQRLKYKWNRSADSMAETRAFLCESSARLYGLRQIKKGSVKRYEIGGVEIFDLHAMNSLSPEVISTSFAHIAHILVLAAHYLSIRLPAEITIPRADYPRPTIFSLASSYKHGEVPFPGSVASQIPPVSDDGEQRHVPWPRPLFIDKPLPTLAKEDPSAYSFFLEGASLLAYDIAWACCSQGVSFGDKDSYEDMCNIGQNLWRLLIGDQLHRRSVEPTFPSSLTPSTGSPRDEDNGEITKPKVMLGRWSHGTLHSFLGEPKKRLSSEAPMLDWEKIEGDEVEDGLDDGVLVRGHGSGGSAGRGDLGAASVMTVRAVAVNGGVSDSANTAKGTSGWTRLKNR